MPEVDSLRVGDPEAVAGYRLVGRLGEGGQGAVFLGVGPAGENVAVKLLHARLAGEAGARTRFVREISAAKRVAPFSTARVLDADVAGDQPYIVTEYVNGPSLQRLVGAEGPRSGGALERLAVGTAAALAAIHQAGIVHRDFKPANVLLGPDGPRVIDFGIARVLDSTATLTSHAVGTPSYMAPEQLKRGPAGPAADLFAWGVTMVFAATGSPAFGNDSVPAVIGRILRAEPDLSGLAEPLRRLVAECLLKDPAMRPTARQVIDRLVGQVEAVPVAAGGRPAMPPAMPPAVPPEGTVADPPYPTARVTPAGVSAAVAGPGRRRWRRRPLLVTAGAIVVAGLVAGIGIWLFGGKPKTFSTVPGGCGMVSTGTLGRWVAQQPVRDADGNKVETGVTSSGTGCEWKSPSGAALFADLTIGVSVEHDIPDSVVTNSGDPPKGLERAKKSQSAALDSARGLANTTGKGSPALSYGPVVTLSGIGDAAFASSYRGREADGSYDAMTVRIEARWGNARVHVEYVSGRYAGPHQMVAPTESAARQGAEATARELVRSLSRCAACTR